MGNQGALSGLGGPIQQTSCCSTVSAGTEKDQTSHDLPGSPVGISASELDVLDKQVSIHGDPT